MENKIKSFLIKYNLLNSDNNLLVGFSGGIDSLALLDILHKLSMEYDFKLTAGHLNHNWRGVESCCEEENARKYCLNKNITFYSEILPENIPHTELEARNRRYEFFNKVSKKYNITAIITGHTLTDQVETVLYRIIKGTGLNGLNGIPEFRNQEDGPNIYRPMLAISREENVEYCHNNNLQPNLDTSNLDDKYLRNRVRLNLIPELKTYNLRVEDAILRLSKLASESESIAKEYMNHIKPMVLSDDGEINTREFFELSLPVRKKIIIDLLEDKNVNYDFEKIDEIITFIDENKASKSGNTLSLTSKTWLFVSSQIIKIIHYIKSDVLKFSLLVKFDQENFHPELNKTIKITKWFGGKPEKYPKESADFIYADLNSVNEPFYLRTRQPGDRIQPFGMKESTKLKKYLINRGVPEFKRNDIPLLTTNSEVLWAVGVGMSELLKVKFWPTHKIEIY